VTISITTVIRDASHLGGGVANVALPLHKAFMRLGATAALISGNEPADAVEHARIVGPGGGLLSRLPQEVFHDIVHIHGLWTPFECRAYLAARRTSAKIVISPHGALEPWAFHNKYAKKKIAWWLYQKRILQKADLLVVNSAQEEDRLKELGLTTPISIILNGVSMEGFRSDLQFSSPRSRIVLFFSRIDAKKGLLDLVEAWSRIENLNDHRLHIQGHGDDAYKNYVVTRIRQLGIEPSVTILPPAFGPERWAAFQTASIFVLPSYSENFGITIAEALMAGLPVVTTTKTPWGDLPSEGLGWIVDNDVPQLCAALQAAMTLTEPQLQEIRVKARAYAKQRFCWEAIGKKYLDVYSELRDR
jgi:glycosyltransferase involved in cell wall biosynthesis